MREQRKKENQYKTKQFLLNQEKPGRWRVNWRDSEGKYRRFRFDAKDLSEAMHMAEATIQDPAILKQQTSPSPVDFPKIQVDDAMLKALETRNWTKHTRKSEIRNCEYFLKWVDKEKIAFWHELRFEHVLKYKKELEDRGMAYDSVRLYLNPIRRTSAWVASNWPRDYVNICQSLRLSRRDHHSSTYDEEKGNPYLSIHQVLDFLDWLTRDEKRDHLTVGVALQGLVGLQLQEALRLTWDKVDFDNETITIEGEVKNRYRIRKIPIPKVVTWLLRRLRNDSTDRTGVLIPTYATHDEYSRAVVREMKRWNESATIKPKDLRNTIQTAAIDGGWYGYYVQRYVGHAPQTIGERHYHGDQGKRLITFFKEKVN